MQIKGNNIQQARLTIRVSRNTLSFSVVDREAEHQLIYEPYTEFHENVLGFCNNIYNAEGGTHLTGFNTFPEKK